MKRDHSYRIIEATAKRVPLLVSVPHSGTLFPKELVDEIDSAHASRPQDTDWFVDKLYDFVSGLGVTMIVAAYSRWVIDLNRDPDNKPLYSDGRIITGLCPVTDFAGRPLYKDARTQVAAREVARRKSIYYMPYHDALKRILDNLKSSFGTVLLWDCHSIKQYVPTIYADKFPDLILGDADGKSASRILIENAYHNLQQSAYSVSHNFPFKGGYITREYGRPNENQHALQLEMAKINYMDDSENAYDPSRAEKMRTLLQRTLSSLVAQMEK